MDNGTAKVERGSGNVFKDLGHPDPETRLLKAELVTRIDDIIRGRGLKQVEAAKLLGLSQPDVSRLLRGYYRDNSVERLLRLLTALGRDVQINIRKSQSSYSCILSWSAERPSVGERRSTTKSGQRGRNFARSSAARAARRSWLTQEASGARPAPLGNR